MDLKGLTSRIPGDPVGKVGERASDTRFAVKVLRDVGALEPVRPDLLAKMAVTYLRWGNNPATASAIAAVRRPDETFIEDELGSLTFGEVDAHANALARALRSEGVGAGDGVAIMARNHRGFVEATLAAAKLGASILYLNTMFAARQLADVIEREGPKVLIYDEEFSDLLEGVPEGVKRFVAWSDDSAGEGDTRMEELISNTSDEPLSSPDDTPRFIILTSGTTGTPKGAQRGAPAGLGPLLGLLDAIPYRVRDKLSIPAPLFHSWGFTHFVIGMALSNTIVLRRKFDPEGALLLAQESGANVLAFVPVMMQRILRLEEETLAKYDLPNLRVTAASGSALPGELATAWMDHFGDNLYNLYGSTEVAYATVASPEDLRAAPGTAGRAPRKTVIRIVDPEGNDVEPGKTGRIFVGNEMKFEGYTGGGGKDELDGLLSSGDVGHFDSDGRLFIDGRDDEMIVSGGENVFPREVEDLLADLDAVDEVAVIGVDDEEYGQRLKAFVVVKDDQELAADDIKKFVKSNLAGYKVPREVDFLDSLPRNATGKVLKRELA